MRLLAICTSLPLGAAGLLAQGSPALNPAGFTVGSFGRSVLAEVTGHQIPDVVVLATEAGGNLRETALLVGAPGVHNSAVVLPNTAGKKIRDVAALPGGDPAHGRDALLLATDLGLFRWCANGVMTRFGGANWVNATRIEAADVDGDGLPEVIGKMGSSTFGNQQNLRALSIAGTTSWMVSTGAPILDLAVVDWVAQSGAVRDEVAFAHGNAVYFVVDGVIDPNLTVALPQCSSARLLAIRAADGTPRLVAGITDAVGAAQLATITPGSPVVALRPVGSPIGGLTLVRNAAGADGVVVANADNAGLMHFAYDPATFPIEGFDFGASLRASHGPANGAADGRLHDLDGDGDLDMVAPSVGTGIVVTRTPGPAAGTDGRPILIHLSEDSYQWQLPAWATDFEILHCQFTTSRHGDGISAITMSPSGVGRTISPAATIFQPGPDWPTHGEPITGPVATLVRAVQRNGGRVVQRGPFRTFIWSASFPEQEFLIDEVSSVLQRGSQALQHSTPGFLAYGARDLRDIFVHPDVVSQEPEESEEMSLALSLVCAGLVGSEILAHPSSQPEAGRLGIVPGAVEPPDLPPPDGDGTEAPDAGDPLPGG